MKKTFTALILLNYNSPRLTLQCALAAAKMKRAPDHIIIADNSPEKGRVSEEEAKSLLPSAEVMINEKNGGFAAGCNPAIKKALELGADNVWLLNNDAIPHEDALDALEQELLSDEKKGACGGMVYSHDGMTLQAAGGGFINMAGTYTIPNKNAEITPDYLTGACMLIKKAALEKTGLLDERFFMYFEDVDYSIRLKEEGFKLAVARGCVIYHMEGQSSTSSFADYCSLISAFSFGKKYGTSASRIIYTRFISSLLHGRIKKTLALTKECMRHGFK